MNLKFQLALASLVVALLAMVPVAARAATPAGAGAHPAHSRLFHDRTPRVHTRVAHPHHS